MASTLRDTLGHRRLALVLPLVPHRHDAVPHQVIVRIARYIIIQPKIPCIAMAPAEGDLRGWVAAGSSRVVSPHAERHRGGDRASDTLTRLPEPPMPLTALATDDGHPEQHQSHRAGRDVHQQEQRERPHGLELEDDSPNSPAGTHGATPAARARIGASTPAPTLRRRYRRRQRGCPDGMAVLMPRLITGGMASRTNRFAVRRSLDPAPPRLG